MVVRTYTLISAEIINRPSIGDRSEPRRIMPYSWRQGIEETSTLEIGVAFACAKFSLRASEQQ